MEEYQIQPQPYWSNIAAGFGLGLVLLLAYYIAGRGLGGSGASARMTAGLMNIFIPEHTQGLSAFAKYFTAEGKLIANDWLVFQVVGVFLGGLFGAVTAGRFKKKIEKGSNLTNRQRLGYALLGGSLMGLGARIARGCTSGQALSGGATLALGSWGFLLALFAGGFITMIFLRRLWQ